MALYWPDQKVALEIVDDPWAEPVSDDLDSDWKVLQVTCAQISNQESMMEIGDELADLLGAPRVKKTRKWKKANRRLMEELDF